MRERLFTLADETDGPAWELAAATDHVHSEKRASRNEGGGEGGTLGLEEERPAHARTDRGPQRVSSPAGGPASASPVLPRWGSRGATGQGVGLPSARRLVSTGSRTVPPPSKREATATVAQSAVPKEQQSPAGPTGPNPEQPPETGRTGRHGSLSQTRQATRTPTERSYQQLHRSAQEDRDGLEGRSWLGFSRKGICFCHSAGRPLLVSAREASGAPLSPQLGQSPERGLVPEALV